MKDNELEKIIKKHLNENAFGIFSEPELLSEYACEKISNELDNFSSGKLLKAEDLKIYIQTCDEDSLTENVVLPLFETMGYKNIRIKGHKDKLLEYGQDIRIMEYELPTANTLFFVAQIKTGNINAGIKNISKNIERIIIQLCMALNTKLMDVDIHEEMYPNHGYFICSGNINEHALNYLRGHPYIRERKIYILDINRILALYENHGLTIDAQIKILQEIKKNK